MADGAEELYPFALEADRHLLGPDQALWLERLDWEREPLHALLEHLIDAGDSTPALALAGGLARFWWMRGHTAAGRDRIERVLRLPGGSDEARAAALVGAGSLAYAAGDCRTARRRYEEALPLLRAMGRELELAHALDRAGMAARQLMDLADAHALHKEALEIQQRLGNLAERALCLNNLGVVAFFRGDLDGARAYHQEAHALREQARDVRGQASSLNNLGQVARFAGDLVAARACMEQGLVLRRQLGDHWGVAGSLVNLAAVHAHLGDFAAARSYLREAVAGFRAVADPLGLCECLEAGAELAHAEGRLADAVRLFACATHRRDCLPAPRSTLLERFVTELLGEIRARLGEETYLAIWQEANESGDTILEQMA
jgi:tetratricopeptide (TPR) repeat protein